MVYYNLSSYNSDMLLVGILSWWYKDGLFGYIESVRRQLDSVTDLFSIKLMIGSLFAPFRQISASSTGISISAKITAFFDRLLSRIIGAIARLIMIIIGLIVITIVLLFGVIGLILWILIPVMPIIGVIGWLCL